MTPAQPARIHLLPAAGAPVVVVIRRKPSKLFQIIRVDTLTGACEYGARFRGQLYPMRSDVSFDGNWFVYMALNKDGVWNAVSRLPRLTAAVRSPNVGTYGGGGYWRSPDVLCMNCWGALGELPFMTEPLFSHTTDDRGVLFPRLKRDGWRRRGDNRGRETQVLDRKTYNVVCTGDDGWERRPSPTHPALVMWYAGFLNGGFTFRFRVPEQPDLLDDEVDWANYDSRGQLVVARRGVVTIYRSQGGLRGRGRLHPARTLDFEDRSR